MRDRNPLSFALCYGLAALYGAIILIILIRTTERFAWWYVQAIEVAS